MVTLPWSIFFLNTFLRPLNPSLGVNRTWAKKSDHAPKGGYAHFFNICPQRAVWGIFFMFDLLPFVFPSFLVTMKKCLAKQNKIKKAIDKKLKWHFFAMVPWHLQWENLFCPSHCKTHWTITMDNVGLVNKSFGDLKFQHRSYIFSWCKSKWS